MAGELISFKLAGDWVSKLWGALMRRGGKFDAELEQINKIIYGDPLKIAEYYVDPECQETNPADYPREESLVVKKPVIRLIDKFFRMKSEDLGDNQLFILSDAGMGKTALLTMLKLMHLTKFWPSMKDCVLTKLGETTLEEIAGIENKHRTILLLDSLDEDPEAFGKVLERIMNILDATSSFFKVIITCRTQFFPDTEEDPFKREGMVKIGGYICPVKYLSFFDKDKVILYCKKRMPKKWGIFTDNKKIDEARAVIEKMKSLRCRPMLLAYIDDFMASPLLDEKDSEYQVYNVLVDRWLDREITKDPRINKEKLLRACLILAVEMQIAKKRSVANEELKRIIHEHSTMTQIMELQLTGRSLLNKNSEGHYRFAHYSIQEFCVAKMLKEGISGFKQKEKIPVTDIIFSMISDRFPPFDLLNIGGVDLKKHPIENSLGMTFVYVPPGTFMMGDPDGDDTETPHKVTLTKGFYMQTTQVTRGQWKAVMGAENNPSKFQGNDRPVERVSWNDVRDFITRLNETDGGGYRLPTEAEWEYSCRAGSDKAYCFGDDPDRLGEYAWYDENSKEQTHPVGQKKPNVWGLYDMHGNVWEWCADWYGEYPEGDATDPRGPESGKVRVVRGGAWTTFRGICAAATGTGTDPATGTSAWGFALCASRPPSNIRF